MLEELLRTWQDPQSRHAILVHFPIALGLLGILPLILLAITGFRAHNLKVVCVGWFVLASGLAYLAAQAGEDAEPDLHLLTPPMSPEEAEAVEEHEEIGENAWIWPLIPAALSALTFVDRRRLRVCAGVLAILAAIGAAGMIGYAAQLGGRLVYVHGLGVPDRGASEATP